MLHLLTQEKDEGESGHIALSLERRWSNTEADHLPIYRETTKLSNVELYRRFGFEMTDEWDVPGGGPQFWSTVRN